MTRVYVGAPSSSLHTSLILPAFPSPFLTTLFLHKVIIKMPTSTKLTRGELRPPAWSSNYSHHHLKVNRGSWLARCPRLEGFPLWVSCSKEVLRQRGNCELCQIMGFRCMQPIKENWGGCLWSICSNLISYNLIKYNLILFHVVSYELVLSNLISYGLLLSHLSSTIIWFYMKPSG